MTLTKNIEPFTKGISHIQLFNPNAIEKQKNEIHRELCRILNNWEYELKFWSKEYQALNKISDLNDDGVKGKANDSVNSFLQLKKKMTQELPEFEKSFRICRFELNILYADSSEKLAEKVERIHSLDRQLWAFKKDIDKYKLEFFQSLYSDLPVSIF